MKQVFLNIKNGKIFTKEVPLLQKLENKLLVKSVCSLISLGTELNLVDFGNKNFIQKALSAKLKVKAILNKIKSDGISIAFYAVKNRIDMPLQLGYCNVGVVEHEIGNFKKGDRVVSNGAHAEYIHASPNLSCQIPNEVSNKEASYAILGSISLNGIKLLNPDKGDTVVVIGFGLIGVLTAKILSAKGCKLLIVEKDNKRIEYARSLNYEVIPYERITSINEETIDGVIICAKTNDSIISDSSKCLKKRRGIVLVGQSKIEIDREDFYLKELWFKVASSYGPGRYDFEYENSINETNFNNYGYTAKSNIKEFLELIESKKINVKDIPVYEFELDQKISENYQKIERDSSFFSGLINYSPNDKNLQTIKINESKNTQLNNAAIVGAGNYTQVTMLPILSKENLSIKYLLSATGSSATNLADKYDIPYASTDLNEIINDKSVNLIFLNTRHNLRSEFICDFLNSGKSVFVEKPLTLSLNNLKDIKDCFENSKGCVLNVGYNRRFSPFAIECKELISMPKSIVFEVNAPVLDSSSWLLNNEVGGGMLVSEICHFIDLAIYLSDSKIKEVSCIQIKDNYNLFLTTENNVIITINYSTTRVANYPKEVVKVYSNDQIIEINNFRSMEIYGKNKGSKKLLNQDKGHKNQYNLLLKDDDLKQLIPFEDIINTSLSTFAALQSIESGKNVKIKEVWNV